MKQATIVPVVRTCPLCGNTTKLFVQETTDEAFYMYQNYHVGYIQDIPVPQFNNDRCKSITREFLKTGYCLECQQLMFGGKKSHYKEVNAYRG